MANSTYKLIYFNNRGRAEIARYVFKLAGQAFEDQRISDAQWVQLKPTAPYGQVPLLEVNGKPYCQSVAIHRFVARQFGFYGKDSIEGLQIDEILGVVGDALEDAISIQWYLPEGEQKENSLEKFKTQTVPKLIKFLDAKLGQKKWYLGDEVSLADVGVFDFLTNDLTRLAGDGWQTDSPALKVLVDNFASLPTISKYLSERPVTPF